MKALLQQTFNLEQRQQLQLLKLAATGGIYIQRVQEQRLIPLQQFVRSRAGLTILQLFQDLLDAGGHILPGRNQHEQQKKRHDDREPSHAAKLMEGSGRSRF